MTDIIIFDQLSDIKRLTADEAFTSLNLAQADRVTDTP